MSHALDNRPLTARLQARIEKYSGVTVDPLVIDLALHAQSLAKITSLSAEVAALSKNVVDFTREDFDSTLNNLRRMGASIDGDNAYKRDLCDSIVGALAMGAQNINPPPADHWGQRFWDIGREERASSESLLKALIALTQIAGECEQIASNYSGTIDGIFEHGGDNHEDPSCAIFHRLYYAMFDARAAIKKATS